MKMKISFSEFILSLGTAALASMGRVDDDSLLEVPRDLDSARYNIDLLLLLRSKTDGNLDADERSLLDSVIYDLQMVYLKETE